MDTKSKLKILLGRGTSRLNKLHLAISWGIEWRWAGLPPEKTGELRSRVEIRVADIWLTAKSWDEDVRDKQLKSNEKTPVAT